MAVQRLRVTSTARSALGCVSTARRGSMAINGHIAARALRMETGTQSLHRALDVLFAVVAEQRALAFDLGVDLDRATPDSLDRAQHVARPVDLEIDALVVVPEQELTTVLVVLVLDVDERLTRV